MAAMVASAASVDTVRLTTSIMSAHNALNGTMASSIASLPAKLLGPATTGEREAGDAVIQPEQDDDSISSVLSSVPSSDLSSLDSEDDVSAKRLVKRRRKNILTPPTSLDEPGSKRTHKRKLIREGPSEYDVEDRKEYLEAGLYSGATNSTGTGSRVKMQRRSTSGKGRLSRSLEEIAKDFRLGLPLYHGMSLLQQERDFRLPWDIRNDFDLSCLPETAEGVKYRSDAWDRIGRQKTPTPYKQISQSELV